MNVIKIENFDVLNGPGFRTTIFVSGCSHQCKGCHNPTSWSPKHGRPYTCAEEDMIIKHLSSNHISGLTLSGGDPFYKDNIEPLERLCKRVRDVYGDTKTIWAWTGYVYTDLLKNPDFKGLLKHIDVIVDGPFEEDKKDLSLEFRGSTNQNIVHHSKLTSFNRFGVINNEK